MKRLVALLILAFVAVIFLGGCAAGRVEDVSDASVSVLPEEPVVETVEAQGATFVLSEYIMHAGGITKDAYVRTNSVDALDISYRDGNYWVELDFNQTADGYWVCVHDWTTFYSSAITGLEIPDKETFELYRKSTYGYESLTLEVLIDWMKKHPEVLVVTDVKENNIGFAQDISRDYPDLIDRFVIQIYNTDEYTAVAECGFEKIIYTLYAQLPEKRYDTELLESFVEQSDKLIALTYAGFAENAEDIAKVCKEIELPIYVHTINDPEEQAFWRELGVYGFYCDYLSLDGGE